VLIRFDEANGKVKSEEVFSDGDLSTYHALPSTQIHRNVDDIILDAGRRGKVDAVVVCPPTIWGTGEGEFNTHSIQVPLLIRACVEFKHGMILEDGANTWSIIHVADLSQAYLTILDAALNGKLPSDPNGRYFFVENGEYQQREVTTTATKLLYEKGKVDSPEPKRISVEDAPKFAPGRRNVVRMTGGNSRSRAVLLRKLGWEAKKGGNKEFIESIKDEVDYVLSTPE
jgi:nucleoside-diphosphate-sugar epimerase